MISIRYVKPIPLATAVDVSYNFVHNAIRAVVILKNASHQRETAGFDLGPCKGVAMLSNAIDNCLKPSEWVQQAVRESSAGCAAGTIKSAISALRSWAAFAHQMSERVYQIL
jgi:hypothetical protein